MADKSGLDGGAAGIDRVSDGCLDRLDTLAGTGDEDFRRLYSNFSHSISWCKIAHQSRTHRHFLVSAEVELKSKLTGHNLNDFKPAGPIDLRSI